jgi:hypothetical protein
VGGKRWAVDPLIYIQEYRPPDYRLVRLAICKMCSVTWAMPVCWSF